MVTTVSQHIRASLLSSIPTRVPDLDALRRSERSPDFERMRANRKVIGAMRYGLMGAEGKPAYDRAADMIRRLTAYRQDGNAEHLIDVANLAELEYVEGNHRGVHPLDDGEHAQGVAP